MAIQRETLLHELISNLRGSENERLREAMAREINNHIFIRGTFTIGQGELTSEDMQVILARLQIVQTTLALSERGQGPEAFAPKKVTPLKTPDLNQIKRSAAEQIEKDFQSLHGGR